MPEDLTKRVFGDSLSVQGTDNVAVPKEIANWFKGKGISLKFLKEHYGFGGSLQIEPDDIPRAYI